MMKNEVPVAVAPFYSVILPAYNRAHLIRSAIESVLEQRFSDWELLIIDDGSRDNTFKVVRELVLKDSRIRYHFAANRGLAMARNLGLTMGLGKYFTFLDSDDEYAPEHLALRAKYLQAHHEVELLHGGVEVIGPDTVADKYDPSRQIPISDCVVAGTFVIRRDLAERLHGFRDVPYGDDNDFFERAQNVGVVIHKIDSPTYRYNRLEPDSLCAIVEREGIEGIRKFRGIT
ncbi:MAG: glycosyltransferase family A protein [Bacteroidota bacterium]|nr:glycosyltransferase family A protein [Bacteroidota bacterium]MDP4231738.1 glycosyltransferase family A protein [Bacteroidota bacterium]MDP4243474.1 glycosyltransferase family A protein [Bacteroidota bacterium]MDP4289361.1 glycosyltransferase family A protein [Bacteroidota bacterium]